MHIGMGGLHSSKLHLSILTWPPSLLVAGGTSSAIAFLALIAFLSFNCWWSLHLSSHNGPDLLLTTSAGDNRNSAGIQSEHNTVNPNGSLSSGQCRIWQGEWVPETSGPLYTNTTCQHIQASQNCLKNGRPDRDYLYWKWKPSDCELPPFNATRFLELVQGKKLAFIGDSLARNQMQSLHCALIQVAKSRSLYSDPHEKEYRWFFPSHNFTLANFQSRFLVNYTEWENNTREVHLDVPDVTWWEQLVDYDIALLSTGYWYFTPSLYYLNNTLFGVSAGLELNVTVIEMWDAVRIALANVLERMTKEYQGIIILRTVTVDHFENGTWSTGGVCKKTAPISHRNGNMPPMDWITRKINQVQVEEFANAVALANDKSRLKLLNVTYSAFLRPDGHPGPYRHVEKGEPVFDCLHWCLPGPIDMWSQLLLHSLSQPFSTT